jgi:prolyl-tRNA editing enzyme YbaK/EbsC (Cys-tRNA(Pro) deacylase)
LEAARAKEVTGYSIGGTPPLGLREEVPVVMDRDLMRHDAVWVGAGRPDTVFSVAPADLARAAGASVDEIGA